MDDHLLKYFERDLSREPAAVHFVAATCLAFTTESGFLTISWLGGRGGRQETHLPRQGTHLEPQAVTGHSQSGNAVTFSMPVALVGDLALQPHNGKMSLVVQHICPEARHTWLGPWDERTAHGLLIALREALRLPRKVGAPLAPTEAELGQDPRRFHGELIGVEGQWRPAFEGSSFVARSTLIFPPGVAKPDRATRLRIEAVWIVSSRPGFVRYGAPHELHARLVEELPWASTLTTTHRHVCGLPLPERLLQLLDRGTWSPRLLGERGEMALLNETGWARPLDTFLSQDEIKEQMAHVRALTKEEKQRLGFAKGIPDCLDEDRALILAKNSDGRMIALDYRRDPPVVMLMQEARNGLCWRRLASNFDELAERFLCAIPKP
jgi:hypothetical protein